MIGDSLEPVSNAARCVEVPVPVMQLDYKGGIIMAGITGMGLSAVAIVAGAIMRFAISVQTTGFNLHEVGIILMIAGAVGFVISIVLAVSTRRAGPGATHSIHSETRDSTGNAVVQDRIEN